MCGRYYVDDDTADEIRRIAKNTDFLVRTGDIRPSETTAVFSQRNGMLSVENMVWGYPGYQGKNLLIMETPPRFARRQCASAMQKTLRDWRGLHPYSLREYGHTMHKGNL
ncbi:MAG: hypothetical protein LIP12_02325 [Clostridiales bacterium]|nr:hypothetical protein [Clostridiales bacterium]